MCKWVRKSVLTYMLGARKKGRLLVSSYAPENKDTCSPTSKG